ncbi:MAG: hypothetical protein V4723_12995 [Pseudomonadota bacterium]
MNSDSVASRGYDVVAVEPSDAMRTQACGPHQSTKMTWIADCLPDLARVRRLRLSFDLIATAALLSCKEFILSESPLQLF